MNDEQYNDNKELMEGCLSSILMCSVWIVAFIIFLLVCAVSCKSQEPVVEYITKTDTCYIDRVQRDSIYQHDSIYIHEWQKGDTIYIDRDHWLTKYRDRLKTDSIYISKTDTVTTTVTKEVEKPLTWWQRFRIGAGDATLVLVALIALYIAFRWLVKRQ